MRGGTGLALLLHFSYSSSTLPVDETRTKTYLEIEYSHLERAKHIIRVL